MSKGDSFAALLIFSSIAGCSKGVGAPATDGATADRSGAPVAAPASEAEAEAALSRHRRQPCRSDADCVPASCCHPTSCVRRPLAPDCSAVLCTDECRPGTLDCGQGHCACVAGSCSADIDSTDL